MKAFFSFITINKVKDVNLKKKVVKAIDIYFLANSEGPRKKIAFLNVLTSN